MDVYQDRRNGRQAGRGIGRADMEAKERIDGFLVHAWTEYRTGRILLSGRSVDGRSFAAAVDGFLPALYIRDVDLDRAQDMARAVGVEVAAESAGLAFPLGEPCVALRMDDRRRKVLAERLADGGILCHGQNDKAADQFLAERGVRAGIALCGDTRKGRRVDLVFANPEVSPSSEGEGSALRWLSLDIETTRAGHVSACGLSMGAERAVFVVATGSVAGAESVRDERELLRAMRDRIVELDPDVITGWNVVDFDLKVIAERSRAHGFPFDAGRTDAPLRILESPGQRTLAIMEGRRCVDAMRVMRSGPERFEDQRLETVARAVLGEGKLLSARGPEKLDELEALRTGNPALYAAYCLRDAELPPAILERTGMGELTRLRSVLTGLDLERAWTSVPAFDRVYGYALRARGVLPAPPAGQRVGGAAGGLILPPRPGLFAGVFVFDFRSLYPSIIRTFNVDPVALLRSSGGESDVAAPNGARFSRERGALPEIVDAWTALRSQALDAGDEPRAYVLKILQNSFYGVLGSPGCAWADDRLAGAITGYGHQILRATRDWFANEGYEVLYGDTDSVFVLAGAAAVSDHVTARALAESLAEAATKAMGALVSERWKAESRLELRFDKLYARFLIPRIRGDRANRLREELERAGATELLADLPDPKGRAKGYAGLLVRPDGSTEIDIKGLEAARGDWTPLARRFQTELLGLVFGEEGEEAARAYARRFVATMRSSGVDGELEFRRVLKRDLDRYSAEAPHVKAARLSGASYRGQVVQYAQTVAGPQPPGTARDSLDYDWYLERQLAPIWESVAEAAGWEPDLRRVSGEQLELF